ncbi:MAG: hypothetical protein EPO52_17595 [Herbiconiux sp.]|uniref:hypothetical protein n=1 Tax=Herbiconiux sp. TaxID=1871186 RepID=UPI00121A9A24|nr:hypothetical protein [Herbiconiux sp.]TAJ46347.1 MAG: hypothetical protein EPO52_17595 [Herbiconiux sp.]
MAARTNPLRAVKPGETAPKLKKPMSSLEAAVAEDRLEELRSMRRRIATALDDPNTPARDLAALTRRQIEIGREIEALVARDKQEAAENVEISDGDFDASAV